MVNVGLFFCKKFKSRYLYKTIRLLHFLVMPCLLQAFWPSILPELLKWN